jgi:hypothetical protein
VQAYIKRDRLNVNDPVFSQGSCSPALNLQVAESIDSDSRSTRFFCGSNCNHGFIRGQAITYKQGCKKNTDPLLSCTLVYEDNMKMVPDGTVFFVVPAGRITAAAVLADDYAGDLKKASVVNKEAPTPPTITYDIGVATPNPRTFDVTWYEPVDWTNFTKAIDAAVLGTNQWETSIKSAGIQWNNERRVEMLDGSVFKVGALFSLAFHATIS